MEEEYLPLEGTDSGISFVDYSHFMQGWNQEAGFSPTEL